MRFSRHGTQVGSALGIRGIRNSVSCQNSFGFQNATLQVEKIYLKRLKKYLRVFGRNRRG